MYFSKDAQGNNKQHNRDKVGGIAIVLWSRIAHSGRPELSAVWSFYCV